MERSRTIDARTRGRGGRRAVVALLMGPLALAIPTTAFADGGTSIAAAPSVAFGQQEFGDTATGGYLNLGCGRGYRSFWAMPVLAGDLVTLDWESAVPRTEMVVAPVGTTDFNMADSDNLIEQALAGNGKNEFQFTAPRTGIMPLWFRSCEEDGATPGPYAFVADDQHIVGVDLLDRLHVRRRSVLSATADLSDGAPVPDGLTFYLNAMWPGRGRARFTATSSGGTLRFPVVLPRRTEGRRVSFVVTRQADPQFLGTRSVRLSVRVARPRASQSKPVRCRNGFRKLRIHGKVECAKIQKQQR